jgi:hypothetical protein
MTVADRPKAVVAVAEMIAEKLPVSLLRRAQH